jgi:site-specific DNA-adenine methylase
MSDLLPFFSFYGGKWRAAPRYPRPDNQLIIEPFAGSAGYSVRHHRHAVLLVDLDEKIIGTWQYLISASSTEISRLPLHFDDVRETKIPQEAQWLIGWWLNKGTTRPEYKPAKWARNPLPGRLNTFWGEGVRQRLASQVEHIRHWRVIQASYDTLPDVAATWFIDPPYLGPAGSRYTNGTSGIDYTRLASWCQSRLGQVMVCENVGAGWLPFQPFMNAKATAGHGRSKISREALWTNNGAVQDQV